MKALHSTRLKQIVLLALTLLALLLMTMFCSCKKSAEKVNEKIMETAIGNNADIHIEDEKITIETDEGKYTSDATVKSWPKDIPSDVPEFKYGKMANLSTMESDEATNWTFVFEEVTKNTLQDYKAELKSNGFKVSSISMPGGQGQISGEKDKIFVTVMAGDGMASLSIGVEK